MSLAAGFVSLFAVLRDYRLRVFTGCFALDPHKSDVELTIPRCLGCRWGLSIIICFPSGASVFYEGRNNKTRNMASMTLSDSNCCHLSPKKRQHWKLGKQREWAFVSFPASLRRTLHLSLGSALYVKLARLPLWVLNMATSRLEINFIRLLSRCESLASEKRGETEWRLEKVIHNNITFTFNYLRLK